MLKSFYHFIFAIYLNRKVLFELVKNDFKQKYLGSYLGILWAFIQPFFTILIFWFVFQVGFKAQPVDDAPFIIWLVTGILPWFFFSESIGNATNSVLENSYLVKKIVFRVSLLPVIKIISAIIIHLFFIVIMYAMYLYYGYTFNAYWLQVIYYLFSMVILILGISWFTSSVVVFFKDIGQLVAMFLQFGFWLTPIFWSLKLVPEKYHVYIKLNPLHYIIDGYRNSMIYEIGFWENTEYTIYFWISTSIILILGGLSFKNLKPHFADVL